MATLNCSSFETALESICRILDVERTVLRDKLGQLCFDQAPEEVRYAQPYDEWVSSEVCGFLGRPIPMPSKVVWFHATRVPRDTPFATTGLLPLKACLPALRERVERLARDLNVPRDPGGATGSYCQKMSMLDDQGPCAFLLREAALGQGTSHRNFLRSPEIIEDLANAWSPSGANEILSAYAKVTEPCIVSFAATEDTNDVVRRALAYCHAKVGNKKDPCFWNTCYPGQGRAVPPKDILGVEWLPG